jgi:hypothetical protein
MPFLAGDKHVKRRNYDGYSEYRGGRQYAKHHGEYAECYDAGSVPIHRFHIFDRHSGRRHASG